MQFVNSLQEISITLCKIDYIIALVIMRINSSGKHLEESLRGGGRQTHIM